jgi:hypothetical protein
VVGAQQQILEVSHFLVFHLQLLAEL